MKSWHGSGKYEKVIYHKNSIKKCITFNSHAKNVLTYGTETWKMAKIVTNKLHTFLN